MTLTFTQSSDQSFGGVPAYEAEFEVTSNFAIHIERTRGDAALILKQRTGGGKYALVDDFNYAKSKGEVLDYEASVSIPKFIKIVSEVEPTLAEIVTDGEVTEIKSQSKVVEITNNGTTEVIPDSGFAYLSKVNIKTNVPQSGEGGGGSTGGVKIIYLNVEAARDAIISSGMNDAALRSQLCFGAVSMKSDYGEGVYDILPFAYPTDDFRKSMIAVAYVDDMKVYDSNGTQMNSSQLIQQYKSMGAYEITEEEFYNINA